MPARTKTISEIGFRAFFAIVIVFFQTQNLLSLGKTHWADFVDAVWQWDANWYDCIARIGYRVTYPALIDSCEVNNAVFAPLFPYSGMFLSHLLHISEKLALVILSLGMACGFWFLLLLLLSRLKADALLQVSVVLFLFWYPTSFFLVIPYTESIFLFFSLAGIAALTLVRGKKLSNRLSFISGFLLSLARFNGVAMLASLVPSLLVFRQRRSRLKIISMSLGLILGCALFFGFLQFRFGSWNIIFHLQKQGFGMNSDLKDTFGFFLNYQSLSSLQVPGPNDYFTHDRTLGYFSLLMSILVSGAGALMVKRELNDRIFWYCGPFAVASLMMSIYASSGIGFRSLSRYSFPVVVMSMLALIACLDSKRIRLIFSFALIAAAMFFVRYQLEMIKLFSLGNWVA